MCARFTLRAPASRVAGEFRAVSSIELRARYNIAPTQDAAVVRAARDTGQRELVFMRWGLIPSWADDPSIGNRMINARADTAATKPAFRHAMKHRRCLVPADGFYEWKKLGKVKQPYHVHLADGGLFAFAGLWEPWRRDDLTIHSFTILTTEANERVRALHDRMPVIIDRADYDLWLDANVTDAAELSHLLVPYAADEMVLEPVSRRVNSPANDDPSCLDPPEAT